jgi:hypothetical protein
VAGPASSSPSCASQGKGFPCIDERGEGEEAIVEGKVSGGKEGWEGGNDAPVRRIAIADEGLTKRPGKKRAEGISVLEEGSK